MSFLACIGIFWDNKFLLLLYSLSGLCMGIVLTMSAVASSMLLTAHVPPIVMQTNRICRNLDQTGADFACEHLAYRRRLEEQSFGSRAVKHILAASEAMAWASELEPERRLSAGVMETQLLERIAAAQDEDICNVLENLCKLPIGVKS